MPTRAEPHWQPQPPAPRSPTWTPPRAWWAGPRKCQVLRYLNRRPSAGSWTTVSSSWSGKSGAGVTMTESLWTRHPMAAVPKGRSGRSRNPFIRWSGSVPSFSRMIRSSISSTPTPRTAPRRLNPHAVHRGGQQTRRLRSVGGGGSSGYQDRPCTSVRSLRPVVIDPPFNSLHTAGAKRRDQTACQPADDNGEQRHKKNRRKAKNWYRREQQCSRFVDQTDKCKVNRI